jgi:hypothetical protein
MKGKDLELTRIRIEVAMYGRVTEEAKRIYTESNDISPKAFDRAVEQGFNRYCGGK